MNVTSLFFYKYKIIISHFASKKLFFFNFKLNFYTFFVKKQFFVNFFLESIKNMCIFAVRMMLTHNFF